MNAGLLSASLRHAAAIALLAALGTYLAPVSPAAAHDMLEATEPAGGSSVASAPPTVRLTFMHTPIAFGSQVVVRDETGSNQSDGPVVVVNNYVSQAVKAGAPAGRYTVVWRVMSRDSHQVEGTFTFTAGSRRGPGQPGTADVRATPALDTAATEDTPWGLAALGAALAAGLAGTALHVRRRLSVNDADGPAS